MTRVEVLIAKAKASGQSEGRAVAEFVATVLESAEPSRRRALLVASLDEFIAWAVKFRELAAVGLKKAQS